MFHNSGYYSQLYEYFQEFDIYNSFTYICQATPSKEIGTNDIRIRDESVSRRPFTKKVYTR